MEITQAQAVQKIENFHGEFMTATFIKRTTGESRTLNFRQGVTKHLKGGPAAYNFSEKKLIPVWSVDASGYRSIPIEGLRTLKVHGETFQIKAT